MCVYDSRWFQLRVGCGSKHGAPCILLHIPAGASTAHVGCGSRSCSCGRRLLLALLPLLPLLLHPTCPRRSPGWRAAGWRRPDQRRCARGSCARAPTGCSAAAPAGRAARRGSHGGPAGEGRVGGGARQQSRAAGLLLLAGGWPARSASGRRGAPRRTARRPSGGDRRRSRGSSAPRQPACHVTRSRVPPRSRESQKQQAQGQKQQAPDHTHLLHQVLRLRQQVLPLGLIDRHGCATGRPEGSRSLEAAPESASPAVADLRRPAALLGARRSWQTLEGGVQNWHHGRRAGREGGVMEPVAAARVARNCSINDEAASASQLLMPGLRFLPL